MKTVETFVFERTIFVYQQEAIPSQQDWEDSMMVFQQHQGRTTGVLVFTEGGAPNPSQRKQFAERYDKASAIPIAVVSDSALARGAITAFRWLGLVAMEAFAPGDLDKALEHSKAEPAARARIRAELTRLRATSGKLPKAR